MPLLNSGQPPGVGAICLAGDLERLARGSKDVEIGQLRIGGHLRRKDFQRHEPAKPSVPRGVDLAHAAQP